MAQERYQIRPAATPFMTKNMATAILIKQIFDSSFYFRTQLYTICNKL